MTRNRALPLLAGAAAVPLATLAVAACGGGTHATTAANAPPTATVRTVNSGLGKILVDSQARTLYLFGADAGTKSHCTGACAAAWPPLRDNAKPVAGSGLAASRLATIARSDGKPQVTYNGHPLYTFVMDKKAGDTNGNGVTAFGGLWFALTPAGNGLARVSPAPGGAAPAQPTTPAAPPPPAAPPTTPAPRTTPAPAPPARHSAPAPAPKQSPQKSAGIPQNNGGDQDSDNNGGPDDGDGGI